MLSNGASRGTNSIDFQNLTTDVRKSFKRIRTGQSSGTFIKWLEMSNEEYF